MTTLADMPARLAEVQGRIRAAAARAGRDAGGVRLIAVSKAKPAELVRAAFAAGQRDFGENYVQELQDKRAALSDLEGIRWHFIGGLQRNKARHVVGAAMLHSVDRVELALELERRAAAANSCLEILIEVNVGGEAQKSGCPPDALASLLASLADAKALSVQGLMTVPPFDLDAERTRPLFVSLRALRDRHRAVLGRGELSMGMSHDFEEAVEEGATLVRVGTAIFGAR